MSKRHSKAEYWSNSKAQQSSTVLKRFSAAEYLSNLNTVCSSHFKSEPSSHPEPQQSRKSFCFIFFDLESMVQVIPFALTWRTSRRRWLARPSPLPARACPPGTPAPERVPRQQRSGPRLRAVRVCRQMKKTRCREVVACQVIQLSCISFGAFTI